MTQMENIKAGDLKAPNMITLSPGDSVSGAINLMLRHDISELPVLMDNKVVGIVSDETFLRKRHLPLKAKLGFVMSPPPMVMEDDTLVDVAQKLIVSGYRGVPVSNRKGEYIGFISRSDIVRMIPEMEDLEDIPVTQIMTPDIMTIGEHQGLDEAGNIMTDLDVRVVPVVDDSGKLVGMVGIRDVLKVTRTTREREGLGTMIGERVSAMNQLEVRSIMKDNPITITPEKTVQEAATLMSQNDISSLVVTGDNGQIVGVITQYDLIELIASYHEMDQAYVQITGLEADSWTFDAMHDSIDKYLKRFAPVVAPRILNIHVTTHKKEGVQTRYNIKLRLQTDKTMFYAHDSDWNIIKSLDEAFETVWRQIKKDKEEHLEMVKQVSRMR